MPAAVMLVDLDCQAEARRSSLVEEVKARWAKQ